MHIVQHIKDKGYPCEEHEVTTDDGYILSLFRIPNKRVLSQENNTQKVKQQNHIKPEINQNTNNNNNNNNSKNNNNNKKPPVLLQHGVLDSSFTFVVNDPSQSLAFILADQGFDVWLGNNRGNTYSKRHQNLSSRNRRFWEFTFDEMAHYDIPAMLQYIFEIREKKWRIAYIGHSQGTTQMFGALGQEQWPGVRETVIDKLSAFVALAPVITVKHIGSLPLRSLSKLQIPQTAALFGGAQFLSSSLRLGLLLRYALPSHIPAGTSLLNMAHWAQNINSGVFKMFDYGLRENQRRYGRINPPHYHINLFPDNIPLMIAYGGDDKMASLKDVNNLISELSEQIKPKTIFLSEYKHLDLIWDKSACQVLYPHIIEFLSKIDAIYQDNDDRDTTTCDEIHQDNLNRTNENTNTIVM